MNFPTPNAGGTWTAWASQLIQSLQPVISKLESGSFRQGQILQVASFTVANLPDPSVPGRVIYVSDESGGAVLAFADGSNWRRATDRVVVS